MPSNQIPEDVREKAIERVAHLRAITTQSHHLLSSAELVDAITPLIIEWARKDQAEVDAQTVRSLSAEYRAQGIGVPGFSVEAQGRILKPFTPETTGGTTNG